MGKRFPDLRSDCVGGREISHPSATAVPRGFPLDLARMWHGSLLVRSSAEFAQLSIVRLRFSPGGCDGEVSSSVALSDDGFSYVAVFAAVPG